MKKKKFKSITVDAETYQEIERLAQAEDRSIANMIRQLVFKATK